MPLSIESDYRRHVPYGEPVETGGRTATMVLCTEDGTLLGSLPPIDLEGPYWAEVAEIVTVLDQRYGVGATVLRLLEAPQGARGGGSGAYLVEVDRTPETALAVWPSAPLVDHPLRQAWARPGGPRCDVEWAAVALDKAGLRRSGPARQIKSWNLSSIWCLPTDQGNTWLKVVPPMFAHEAAVVAFLGSPDVPRLLAGEPGRMLMADIAGDDNFSASGGALLPMVRMLTDLQLRCIGLVDELLALGVPDHRLIARGNALAGVVAGHQNALEHDELRALDQLLAGLDVRCRDIESCGVPETLAHGDFHPGNVRGPFGGYVILDWSDSCVAHPLTDELAFFRPLSAKDRALVGSAWTAAWRDAVPGCDPDRAKDLLRPLMPVEAALTYAEFCANIEPDERVYHAIDVTDALKDAAEIWRHGHR